MDCFRLSKRPTAHRGDRALFDHAASILILAQSNKLRMIQMAAFRPFQEFNSRYGPILRGPSGKPLNLDNLSKRLISPY
jgi:hypothetical protein